MAKKKFYAVKIGMQAGIFDSWDKCRTVVDGYAGAEYKGFSTREEAEYYLGISQDMESDGRKKEERLVEEHLVAYVDGSYHHGLQRYAFGCILLTPDGKEYRYSGNGNQPDSLAIRNVAGEMLGAMYAVRWAIHNRYTKIELRYDYEGIEKWVTGVWKAKTDLTQKYATYMRKCEQKICICFTKVEAHAGNFYNEEVDGLAKQALTEADGIPEVEQIEY